MHLNIVHAPDLLGHISTPNSMRGPTAQPSSTENSREELER